HAAATPVRLPSRPAPFAPQQYAGRSTARAHACRAPVVTARKCSPPPTALGALVHGSGPPEVGQVWMGRLPSSPSRPHPQQYALESVALIPHVNVPPPTSRTEDKVPLPAAGS